MVVSSSAERKNILITGGNFLNQGAFLMLIAAANEIREMGAQPIVEIQHGTAREKARYGFDALLGIQKLHLRPSGGKRHSLRRVKDQLPFVFGGDIDAVFDVSGFAFGDQWAEANLIRKARYFEYWSKRQVPVYLLPQAFGPFKKTAEPAELAVKGSRMVFARDPDSERYLLDILDGESRQKVRRSPDFTALVDAVKPQRLELLDFAGAVPIVPNYNIVQRAPDDAAGARYIETLENYVREIRAAGFRAYGLCHEGRKDEAILVQLAKRVGDFPVVSAGNGLESKWLLGQAPMVVAGRFHALVSALSQGVPAVLHGWSHKYQWLAQDFGAETLVRDPYLAGEDEKSTVSTMASDEHLRAGILAASKSRKIEARAMWDDIVLDVSSAWGNRG